MESTSENIYTSRNVPFVFACIGVFNPSHNSKINGFFRHVNVMSHHLAFVARSFLKDDVYINREIVWSEEKRTINVANSLDAYLSHQGNGYSKRRSKNPAFENGFACVTLQVSHKSFQFITSSIATKITAAAAATLTKHFLSTGTYLQHTGYNNETKMELVCSQRWFRLYHVLTSYNVWLEFRIKWLLLPFWMRREWMNKKRWNWSNV